MGLFGSDKNPRAELAVLFAKDEVQLIRELRRTELNLDLKTATYLAEQTAKAAR